MAQTRRKTAKRRPSAPSRENKRKLININILDIEDVRDRIDEQARERQYSHREPFLRRVLVLLFRDGQIDRLKF